jgi:hypothetical protein
VPESGNWHGGTCTRWIAALSATPVSTPPGGRGNDLSQLKDDKEVASKKIVSLVEDANKKR